LFGALIECEIGPRISDNVLERTNSELRMHNYEFKLV